MNDTATLPLPANQPQLHPPTAVDFPAVPGVPSQVLASTAGLISTLPLPRSQSTQHGVNGLFRFEMPACARNKIVHRRVNPVYLMGNIKPMLDQPAFFDEVTDCADGEGYVFYEFCDTQSLVMNWESNQIIPRIVPAGDVADMLVKNWNSGSMGRDRGGFPGIIRFEPKVPIDLQVRRSREALSQYFVALVADGDDLAARKDHKNITFMHRVAAEWLGIENRDWYQEMRENRMKACPACGERILQQASKCRYCQENLHLWYERFPHPLDPLNDPVIAAFIAQQAKLGNAAEQPSAAKAAAPKRV